MTGRAALVVALALSALGAGLVLVLVPRQPARAKAPKFPAVPPGVTPGPWIWAQPWTINIPKRPPIDV